ncbi:MAG: DUF177 domain-containing protein [Verrucomicrobiae bacterium]|nr:DUF177 domain-containing protein [Verrucomicrobiae bacterium]
MITVYLGEIPEEGLEISGETSRDIFQLDPADEEVQPAGPVRYDLHISDAGSDLLLAQGKLVAPFTLRCVACLEPFPFTLELDHYAADFDTPASGKLDMTERIREDLLLEIPGYPHCDRDGDDPDRVCPAAGKFDGTDSQENRGNSAWDALDGLKDAES